MEQGKPINKSGMMCPHFKKNVAKVCHNCELYRPHPIEIGNDPKNVQVLWECCYVWTPTLTSEVNKHTFHVAATIESARNQQKEDNASLRAEYNKIGYLHFKAFQDFTDQISRMFNAAEKQDAIEEQEKAKEIEHVRRT